MIMSFSIVDGGGNTCGRFCFHYGQNIGSYRRFQVACQAVQAATAKSTYVK